MTRLRFTSSALRMPMKRTSTWGMPKYPSPHASIEMTDRTPYSAASPKTGISFSVIWAPASVSTGTAISVPLRKPGMACRKATVFSTPPAQATDPMRTTARAKNISTPWTKSVATTER